ncbi:hypothetical protein LXL04_035756 [Taraxacum kok-saghyz]
MRETQLHIIPDPHEFLSRLKVRYTNLLSIIRLRTKILIRTILSIPAYLCLHQPGKTFISKARIDGFEMKTPWFTALCPKCPKQISKKGSTWFCTTDSIISSPSFTYTVSAIITDDTNEMLITLADNTVNKLTRISCEQMIAL